VFFIFQFAIGEHDDAIDLNRTAAINGGIILSRMEFIRQTYGERFLICEQ